MYYFHQGWQFFLTGVFPLAKALEENRDKNGYSFYEKEYEESRVWERVTLPHTFNDGDLFCAPIQDGGSGQKRCVAFYRNWIKIGAEDAKNKIFLEFEGMRQTCYLYVNGKLVGYYEAGVGPFGFDISDWIVAGENLIAVATDNTSTRNIPYCIAETPNKPEVEPGSYLCEQEEKVPESMQGIGFQWNCNDFNPTLGGITHPVKLHMKKNIYLTLPLYSNLETKGTYVYGKDYELDDKTITLCVEAEIRNESDEAKWIQIQVTLRTLDGTMITAFQSEVKKLEPVGHLHPLPSITPEDAYYWNEKTKHYEEAKENQVLPTKVNSVSTRIITTCAEKIPIRFWHPDDPYLYRVEVELLENGVVIDKQEIETGFRKAEYDADKGLKINGVPIWLRGYAQRATNEWAAAGIVPEWLHDQDASWIRKSNANHIRFMHVAASPEDIRAYDRHGIVCTQPAGDKERETYDRQWDQRVELMRNILIAYRNNPCIFFWEAGNNSISKEHMNEMRKLKERLDPSGGRFMGCRTLNTQDVIEEAEYVGTMLNRHAARFISEHVPITETEYAREEAPRRVWDDYSPPEYDYSCKWLGKGGKKQKGMDFYDLTSEELAIENTKSYSEFFNDRMGGASKKNYYSACAALCWTDSAQHGRQSFSENGRMSGRVDPARIQKQSFDVFRVMQSEQPDIYILGHWNYPPLEKENYRYPIKSFQGSFWEENGNYRYRDARHKTVYVIASYAIERVELYVNGNLQGSSSEPQNTFLFAFPGIDITNQGYIEAVGYGYDGKKAAVSRIETADSPKKISLEVHTAPIGFLANGQDLTYVDIKVTDNHGRICPLCDGRITFEIEGNAVFLGGYNSGRFDGNGKNDNVIHQKYVYAECGINRVFLKSTRQAGKVVLYASMEPGICSKVQWQSRACDLSVLSKSKLTAWYPQYQEIPPVPKTSFCAIAAADEQKYVAETEDFCKILVDGQEPDFRGVRAVNRKGSIWGNVICILDSLQRICGDKFSYQYQLHDKKLILESGGHMIVAEAGVTHLLIDGNENLIDGEPYITDEGIFVMEVNTFLSNIQEVSVQYDEKIHALRIKTK